MQDNHIQYIELQSTDFIQTKNFYTSSFGWKFIDYGDNARDVNENLPGERVVNHDSPTCRPRANREMVDVEPVVVCR